MRAMAMVEYETRGRFAVLTLNRIEARNAINRQVAQEMEAAIDAMEADPEVWVGVLTARTQGDKPTFCSGQDLKLIGSPEGNSTTKRGGFAGLAKRERTKPLIAAVDGLATAGGCEIVLSCDLVVATTRSSFGLAEVKRNLIAGAGGLFRLPWAIGKAPAMQAILTGEPLPAERAYQLGLVNELVAPGEAEQAALALAAKICENAPMAIWASRKVVAASVDHTEEQLWALTDESFKGIMGSEDLKEGLAAFAEKRAPQWKGR
jgi:enoyl-CoA hydratase